MPATFSKLVTVSAGQTITASERNAEFDNILNNLDPSGMGDYSVNTTQMRAVSDPYPGAVESLATDLAGELERIRFVIKQISGETQWYIDPDASIATLAAIVPAGTAMVFFQAAAPTGWTKSTTHNNKALRVVSGTGGGNGGSHDLDSPPSTSHSHTGTSNAGGNHDHGGVTADFVAGAQASAAGPTPTSNTHHHDISASGTHTHGFTTDAASPTAFAPKYIDVIVCTKD